jgi:competence protein ComEC
MSLIGKLVILSFVISLIEFKYISILSTQRYYRKSNKVAPIERYFCANTRCLSSELKKEVKSLNLAHLFTPSGLHYTAASKLLPRIISRHQYFCWIILIILMASKLEAIKRIALFRLMKSYRLGPHVSLKLSLLIYLILLLPPEQILSFIFSGVFLSVIIFSTTNLMRIKLIVLTNYLSALIFTQPIYLLAAIGNIAISGLYCLSYPLHMLSYLTYKAFELNLFLNAFNWVIDNLIFFTAQICAQFGSVVITIDLLIIIYFVLWRSKNKFVIMLLVCIYSTQTGKSDTLKTRLDQTKYIKPYHLKTFKR